MTRSQERRKDYLLEEDHPEDCPRGGHKTGCQR